MDSPPTQDDPSHGFRWVGFPYRWLKACVCGVATVLSVRVSLLKFTLSFLAVLVLLILSWGIDLRRRTWLDIRDFKEQLVLIKEGTLSTHGLCPTEVESGLRQLALNFAPTTTEVTMTDESFGLLDLRIRTGSHSYYVAIMRDGDDRIYCYHCTGAAREEAKTK